MVLALGCGKPQAVTYEVKGLVSCDGKPVPTGQITFLPNGPGRSVSGAIGADGNYSLAAPVGPYKVTVIAIPDAPMEGVTKDNWIEAFQGKSPTPYVPSYFGDADTTPVAFTVEATDQNVLDIPITTPGKRKSSR